MTGALVLTLLLAAAPGSAKPDFSSSTVTAEPATPGEGDVVTFLVTLRNSGDEDATYTEVVLRLPLEALFVDLSGIDGSTVDLTNRTITALVDLPAGASKDVRFRVVVPRDAGGRVLMPDLEMRNPSLAAEYYDSATAVVETRIGTDGILIGAFRIAPAGLGVLAVLLLYPVLWLIIRARIGSRPRVERATSVSGRRSIASRLGVGPAVLAIVIPIGFWAIFAAMAWTDWRSLRDWRGTTCTILDSRLRAETSTSSDSAGSTRRVRSSESTSYSSLLALRYQADGEDMISTGFDTGSRLNIGGAGGASAELARWSIGRTVPCWYDPLDHRTVVVTRGFGGAYLFALFPLPVFLLGLAGLRVLLARPARPPAARGGSGGEHRGR